MESKIKNACQFFYLDAYPPSLSENCKQSLISLLNTAGISCAPVAPRTILLTSHNYADSLPALTNPTLLLRLTNNQFWFGPVLVPNQSVCPQCLTHWLRTASTHCPPAVDEPPLAALPSHAASLLAAVATDFVRETYPEILHSAIAVHHLTTGAHSVSRLSAAPGCNCLPAGRTLDDWVDPITGILPEVHVTDTPICGLYLSHARFSQPLPQGTRRFLIPPDASYGSAADVQTAATTAVAEALERYSLTWQGNEPERIAPFTELPGAIGPATILGYSPAQYARHTPTKPDSDHWIPAPFEPTQPVPWTEGVHLASGQPVWLLSSLCRLWRDADDPHTFTLADTNGCAAAPTLAEAQFRALLELVERDAVGIWWYNRLRRPEIPIHLLDHIPSVAAALPSLPTLQRSLHFLDVTTDLAVPAVVAVLARLDGSQPFFGAAAHPDPAIAVTKALRESVQFMFWAQTEHAAPDVKAASIHRHPWLRPHGSAPVPAPLPLKNVGDLVRHLARHHLNAYAVDMTRPEIGLPVARTIVPGLVHHWSRFAQRRLYEVPVRMGWLPNPLAESELNPWNCPL